MSGPQQLPPPPLRDPLWAIKIRATELIPANRNAINSTSIKGLEEVDARIIVVPAIGKSQWTTADVLDENDVWELRVES